MALTLDQIDAALMAALQPLSKAHGGSVDYVGRYNGEVTRAHGIDTETMGAPTAVLLAFEGEIPEKQNQVRTILKGVTEVVGRTMWRVYVVVQRVGDTDAEIKGDGTDPGIFGILDRVIGALSFVRVEGLFQNDHVDLSDVKPHLLMPGQASVYLVRFSALRVIPTDLAAAGIQPPSQTLTEVQMNLSVVGADTSETNPIAAMDVAF